MPWDPQTKTLSFVNGDSTGKSQTYRMETYWNVVETGSKTYTINWSYSVDNVNFVTLKEHTGKVQGNEGIEDLAAQSNKPSGSKFLKVTATPSAGLGGGDSGDVTIKMTWWIEDQENSGVKVV